MTLVRARKAKRAGGGVGEGGDAVRASYASDPYRWALEQAELLRTGRLDLIDAQNIADEIADVTHYLADRLRSDLVRVLQHLLKWDHQSQRRSRSWALSIKDHRRRVDHHLKTAPSVASMLPSILADAYLSARNAALAETNLPDDAFPLECRYSWDDIMTRPILWPDPS